MCMCVCVRICLHLCINIYLLLCVCVCVSVCVCVCVCGCWWWVVVCCVGLCVCVWPCHACVRKMPGDSLLTAHTDQTRGCLSGVESDRSLTIKYKVEAPGRPLSRVLITVQTTLQDARWDRGLG